MSVLRRAYVEVEPDVTGFDTKLKEKIGRQDPGGKAGKQVGGQLNRALKRFDLAPIDVKADPKSALAGIAVAEARLRELSGKAATVEVKIQTDRALGQLARFRKQIGDVSEEAGPEAALGFAARFSQRLGPLVANLPISGPMGIAIGGAAAAAAPLLASAVAGGIIGGVGIGGVVGGLTLAAKDERVKAAAKSLGDRLESRLNRAAGSFVNPAIEGLHQIQRVADDIDLEGIFGNSAKFVPVLTSGVAEAVTAIGKALASLIENADGPIRAIADGIALIGKTAATGLKSLADNGQQGASALNTLFTLISSGVGVTFQLVNALTELYGIGQKIGADTGLQVVLKLTSSAMNDTAESARRTGSGTFGMSQNMIQAAESAEELKKKQEALKAVQDAVKVSQDNLQRTLDGLGGKTQFAASTSNALRTAMDNLYGASIRQTDANEDYQASWDDLADSVKSNKTTLDIHSAAGRANRDVLQSLLTKNGELYLANINAGVSIDSARRKHENRTKAIKEEARRLGLNREETGRLIATYGKIPGKKTTELVLDGVREVARALTNLYIYQRSLVEGKSISLIEDELRKGSASGPAKRFGGYRQGGRTGNVAEDAPAGVVHGREFVVNAPTVRRIDRQAPGFLDEMHATGQLPGYADGGRVAPVDTSRRWPFHTDVSGTRIMSRAQVASKVVAAFPTGGRTSDFIVAAAKALVPGIRVLSKDRPGARTLSGNRSYHSMGRAVDFAPSEKLARLWNEQYKARTKELISPYQRYNIHNGQRHTYTGAIWNQHNFAGGNAHDHIAMAGGGVIGEPVFGVGRSGRSYSFGERGPETVTPGVGGEVHIHIHNSVITSKRAAEDLVVEAYRSAKDRRRI